MSSLLEFLFLIYLFWVIFFLVWIQPKRGILSYKFTDKVFATLGIINFFFLCPIALDLFSFLTQKISLAGIVTTYLLFDSYAIFYLIKIKRKRIALNKKEAVFLTYFYFVIFYFLPQILSFVIANSIKK